MKNAKEEWRSAFGIDEKYGFANLDEAQLNEEAVAYAFREYGREARVSLEDSACELRGSSKPLKYSQDRALQMPRMFSET